MNYKIALFLLFISLKTISFFSDVKVFDNLVFASDAVQLDYNHDSKSTSDKEIVADKNKVDESFNLMLLVIIAVVMCIIISVGISFSLTILAVLFGLISLGIVSLSVLVGLYKKSFERAFETLIITSSSMFGTFAGATICGVGNAIFHWFSTNRAIGFGALIGLVSGFLLGLLLVVLIQRITAFLKEKLEG